MKRDSIGRCPGRNLPRPDGKHRHPDSTLVKILLAAPQRAVGTSDAEQSSIVTCEDNQRLTIESGRFECGQHLSDAVIHMLDQRDQTRPLVVDSRLAAANLLQPLRRRLNRVVRSVVGKVKKERRCCPAPALHVVDRPLCKEIGCMTLWLDRLAIEPHVVVTMAKMVVVIVHHIAQKPVKMIETTIVGKIGFGQTKVPLANDRRLIPDLLQPGRKHPRISRKLSPTVIGMRPNHTGDSGQIGILSGHQ